MNNDFPHFNAELFVSEEEMGSIRKSHRFIFLDNEDKMTVLSKKLYLGNLDDVDKRIDEILMNPNRIKYLGIAYVTKILCAYNDSVYMV